MPSFSGSNPLLQSTNLFSAFFPQTTLTPYGKYRQRLGDQNLESQTDYNVAAAQAAQANADIASTKSLMAQLAASRYRGGGGNSSSASGGTSTSAFKLALDQLMKGMNEATGAQRKANQERFDRAHGILKDSLVSGEKLLADSGAQASRDINQAYREQNSAAQSRLINMGLGNTGVGNSVALGSQREAQAAQNRLNESVNQQRLGLRTGVNSQLAQLVQNVEDPYPNYQQLLPILLQLAQASATGGGNSSYDQLASLLG